MLRSMYTAGAAMMTYNRKMDTITNNLVNVETAGYKADTLATRSFRDLLIDRINDPNMYVSAAVGRHNTGIHVDQVYTKFDQGSLDVTDVSTDFALIGDGFFMIDYSTYDENGDMVSELHKGTRSGAFQVDGEGFLVTPDGHYVLGVGDGEEDDEGNVAGTRISVVNKDFVMHGNGDIYDSEGNFVDTLLIKSVEDKTALRKEGENMYFNFDPANNRAFRVTGDNIVRQGYLEMSNVDSSREMVNMMQVYRAYEINQRVLRGIDESLGRAVNDIARF